MFSTGWAARATGILGKKRKLKERSALCRTQHFACACGDRLRLKSANVHPLHPCHCISKAIRNMTTGTALRVPTQRLQQTLLENLSDSCCIQCTPSADSLSAWVRCRPKQFAGTRATLIMDLEIEQTLCIIKPDACKAQKHQEIMQARITLIINDMYMVMFLQRPTVQHRAARRA